MKAWVHRGVRSKAVLELDLEDAVLATRMLYLRQHSITHVQMLTSSYIY